MLAIAAGTVPTTVAAASEGSRVLSESSSPLLRALADYESHFQLQVNQSRALEQSARATVDVSRACTEELQVQADAIDAAIANLDIFKECVPLFDICRLSAVVCSN